MCGACTPLPRFTYVRSVFHLHTREISHRKCARLVVIKSKTLESSPSRKPGAYFFLCKVQGWAWWAAGYSRWNVRLLVTVVGRVYWGINSLMFYTHFVVCISWNCAALWYHRQLYSTHFHVMACELKCICIVRLYICKSSYLILMRKNCSLGIRHSNRKEKPPIPTGYGQHPWSASGLLFSLAGCRQSHTSQLNR